MKHILFPTDFSAAAANAIDYGIQLLYGEQYDITLFNACDIPIPTNEQAILPENYVEQLMSDSLKGLEKAAKEVRERHPHLDQKINTVSKIGPLSEVIQDFTTEKSIDLIVMGTHGRSGIGKLLLGSNTFDVIKKINCPVLSIPEHYKFKTPTNVTLAIDDKPIEENEIFEIMLWIAKKFESKVNVLNVMVAEDDVDDSHIDQELLDKFLNSIDHEYVFVENQSIEEGIFDYVSRNRSEMLTMVVYNRNFFERLFHPSVTKKIALEAKIPLLTIHG